MQHKELVLFFRVPIPFIILYLYNAFQDSDMFYTAVSEAITTSVKDSQAYDAVVLEMISRLKEDDPEINLEGIARGLNYLKNFALKEITASVGPFDVKKLQSVSVVEPDTMVATFFSTGKDELYARLCPST